MLTGLYSHFTVFLISADNVKWSLGCKYKCNINVVANLYTKIPAGLTLFLKKQLRAL